MAGGEFIESYRVAVHSGPTPRGLVSSEAACAIEAAPMHNNACVCFILASLNQTGDGSLPESCWSGAKDSFHMLEAHAKTSHRFLLRTLSLWNLCILFSPRVRQTDPRLGLPTNVFSYCFVVTSVVRPSAFLSKPMQHTLTI